MPGRYSVKDGKIYDGGVVITPQELQMSRIMALRAMEKNEDAFKRAPAALKPIMQKGVDVAREKLSSEVKEMDEVMKALGLTP